jgi:hypothetical protein
MTTLYSTEKFNSDKPRKTNDLSAFNLGGAKLKSEILDEKHRKIYEK